MAKLFFPIIKQQSGINVVFLTLSLFCMLLSGGVTGCATAPKPAILHLKPYPRDAERCAVHPRFASFKIKTLAVLPFEDSDKTIRGDWVSPSETTIAEYLYPIQEDGEYVAGLIGNELVNSFKYNLVERSKIDKIVGEMALGQTGLIDEQKAKMMGNLIGADAIITGRVTNCFTSLLWRVERGGSWFAAYLASVNFRIRMIDVESGSIVVNCEKSGNSYNYLDREYFLNSDVEMNTNFAETIRALHGTDSVGRIGYIAKKLTREIVQEIPYPADF
jgi:hypothetical protein